MEVIINAVAVCRTIVIRCDRDATVGYWKSETLIWSASCFPDHDQILSEFSV